MVEATRTFKASKSNKDSAASSAETLKMSGFKLRAEPRYSIMLLLAVGMYAISASIGSGWVLFISCGLFCCCLLAALVPFWALKACRVELAAPEQVSAGDEFPVAVRIRSSEFFIPLSRWMILRMVPAAEQRYGGNDGGAFLLDSLEEELVLTLRAPGLKRGIRPLLPLAIETAFPMGMLWATAFFQSEKTLAVLPKIESVEGKFLFRLRSGVYVPGDAQSTNTGFQSCSSRGVRLYNRGDSRRFIHWSCSAKHGRLMVRELEQEGLPAFDLFFDAAADWQNPQQFELALSAVASILDLGHSSGIHPDLFILDKVIKAGEQPGLRSTDIDQQLLSLAALEYKKTGKADSKSCTEPEAFASRSRAVVLVSPLIASANSLSDSDEKSRSSVFVLKVSAEPELIAKPYANAHEFVLCKKEELCDL